MPRKDSLNGLYTYTNTDLPSTKKRQATEVPFGTSTESPASIRMRQQEANQARDAEQNLDAELAASQESVNQAERFLNDVSGQNAAWQADATRDRPLPSDLRLAMRALTEGTDTAAGVTGLGSLVPTPASPFLGAASLGLAAPGALRRLLLPDEDESRGWGAAEAAILAAIPASRALRTAKAIPVPSGLGMGYGSAAGKGLPNLAEQIYGETRAAESTAGRAFRQPKSPSAGAPTRPSIFEDIYGPNTAPTTAAGEPIGMSSVKMEGRTLGGNPRSDIADFENVPNFTFEGAANARPGEFPPGLSVDIPGFGPRIRAVDNSGAAAEPLNYTKSGYLQRPGESRTHRRGWNAQQVEAARTNALKGIRDFGR